jgi:hypothetical protein
MKTPRWSHSLVQSLALEVCRLTAVAALAVVWLQPGHASEPVWLPPGAVAVTAPEAPAAYAVDPGRGQVESKRDRAQEFARDSASTVILAPTRLGVVTDFGAVGVALSPVAALTGAVSAKVNRLDSGTLSQVEEKLRGAMAAMAAQQHLCDAVLKVTASQPHRRFLSLPALASAGATGIPVSAVLETKLEELHLRRTGKGDESFALCVKARARVVRVSDGKTLFDEPFEHQSGTGLFLDWSLGSSVQNVAETCYRRLAERMVERLQAETREEPALVGAGFRKPYLPPAPAGLMAASAGLMPAAYRGVAGSTFGVYATSSIPQLVIQAPRTKSQAVKEAGSDGRLGELVEFPNPVVSAAALVAAIPVGLFKQGSAMFNGLTDERFLKADKQISLAAYQARLHEGIAVAVVDQLAPQTSQAVALVPRPKPTGDLYQAALLQCTMHGTLTALPRGVTARDYLASQGMSQALEVHVTKAVLKGNGGINPPLALHLEATVAVLRSSDGQTLFACLVRYQGRSRKFEEWANHDAKLLREEMQTCYAELGRTIATQLIARKVLPPKGDPASLLAIKEP